MRTKFVNEKIDIHEDGSQTCDRILKIEHASDLKDPIKLLGLHGYDPDIWDLVNSKNSIWETQIKGGTIDTLYASKITVSPKSIFVTQKELVEHFEKFERVYKPSKIIRKQTKGRKRLLEVIPADLHLGKLAYNFESGESYNIKLAEKRMLDMIKDVISKVTNADVEKVLFVWGNDYFHFDTPGQTTKNGTPQHSDIKYRALYKTGVELLVKAIDLLKTVADVDVMCVPGNHDTFMCFHAHEMLRAWYKDDKNVYVMDDIKLRKYYVYGKTLLGFTHGNEEGSRIYDIMQVEESQNYAKCPFREFHMGHLHSESMKEKNGICFRRVSSMCGTDEWHHNCGWIGSVPRCQSFLFDKKTGLDSILYYNVF